MKRTAMKQRAPKDPGPAKHTREFVLRRDGGCVLRNHDIECWGGIHIHHVLPRSRGGQHGPNNLQSLCAFHHQFVHSNPMWAREAGHLR